jgi:hypothetical protein
MKKAARLISPQDLKKSGPGLLRGPILYGAVYIRPLPSQFILPRPSPLSNEGSIQIRGPVPNSQLKHVRCPDLPTPWRESGVLFWPMSGLYRTTDSSQTYCGVRKVPLPEPS